MQTPTAVGCFEDSTDAVSLGTGSSGRADVKMALRCERCSVVFGHASTMEG